jgi:hypothetical protein
VRCARCLPLRPLPPARQQPRAAEAPLHPQPLLPAAFAVLLPAHPRAALPSDAALALAPCGLRGCQPAGRVRLGLPVLPQRAGLQVLRGPPAPAAAVYWPSSARQGAAPLELQAVRRHGTHRLLWDLQALCCCPGRLALARHRLPAAGGSPAAGVADTAAAPRRRCVQVQVRLWAARAAAALAQSWAGAAAGRLASQRLPAACCCGAAAMQV